ncbi:hypothetical protein Hte_008785 [Hypoxylon texense]
MHPISLIIVAISAVIFALPRPHPHPHPHPHPRPQLGSELSSAIVDSLTGALGVSGGRHNEKPGCNHGFNNGAFTACINDCVALCEDEDAGCHDCFDTCSPHIGCEDEDEDNDSDGEGNTDTNGNHSDATRHRNGTNSALESA